MRRHALLGAVRRHEQQHLLAEHEHRAAANEMHRDDRPARRDGLGAIDDGRDGAAGVSHGSASSHATLETLADFLFGQIAPDEHDAALALLAVLPFALVIAVEHHVHALEHEAQWIVLQRQDAL